MRDFMDIGSTPSDEPCAQVGEPDYEREARTECAHFIELIRKVLGPEPDGAHLAVKGFPHDFGQYYEVVCYFEDSDEEARNYAFRCESETPAKWDTAPQEPAHPKVCDSCLTVAYDNASPGDRETAALIMVELGADLEDHICDQVEARDLNIKCTCGCRRR